jgi:hypothetical protein
MHKVYGRDVSRFLTGSYHLEEYSDLPAYTHSKQAFAILEKYKFGEIKDEGFNIVKKGFKQTVTDHHQHTTHESYLNDTGIELQETFVDGEGNQKFEQTFEKQWEFVEMEALSQDTFVYHFKCKDFKVNNWIPGTRWFGRHFMLNFAEHDNL